MQTMNDIKVSFIYQDILQVILFRLQHVSRVNTESSKQTQLLSKPQETKTHNAFLLYDSPITYLL